MYYSVFIRHLRQLIQTVNSIQIKMQRFFYLSVRYYKSHPFLAIRSDFYHRLEVQHPGSHQDQMVIILLMLFFVYKFFRIEQQTHRHQLHRCGHSIQNVYNLNYNQLVER